MQSFVLDSETRQILDKNLPSYYISSLFSARSDRWKFQTLFALVAEMENIPRLTTDPMMGGIRFSWWSEQLERISHEHIERHPLLALLAEMIDRAPSVRVHLLAIVHAAHDALDHKDNDFLNRDYRGKARQAMVMAAASFLSISISEDDASRLARALVAHADGLAQQDAIRPTDYDMLLRPLILPLSQKNPKGPIGPLGFIAMVKMALF